MAKELYYAHVEVSNVEYFDESLEEHKDKIKLVYRSELRSADDGTQFITYILEAEEGTIDPQWKLI